MARAAEVCYTEKSLIEVFEDVEHIAEFRDDRGKRHPLSIVLLLYLIGQLIGFLSYRSIQRNLSDEKIMQKIEEYVPLEHGVPSYSTFSRVISQIAPEYLLGEICDWIWQLLPEDEDGQEHYGIDGKALRAAVNKATAGNSLYMVNVHNVVLNIFVYMIQVGNKTNERAEIERNIQDIIHGHHCLITMDAMGTGIHMLDLICKEGSDAVLPVKENQKTLSWLISNYLIKRILEHSQSVEHYLDLEDFSETDLPSRVIENTRCSVVQEDNPNNGPYTSEEQPSDSENPSEQVPENAANVSVSSNTVSNHDKCTSSEPAHSSDEKSGNVTETNSSSEKASDPQIKPTDSDGQDASATSDAASDSASGFSFFDSLYTYHSIDKELEFDPKNKRLAYVLVGNRYISMVSTHGRFERREYEYTPVNDELRSIIFEDLFEDWRNVKGIGLVTRYRATLVRDKKTKEKYYNVTISRTPYLLTMESSVEKFAEIVKSHWGIETPLHHELDTLLGEDKCTVRKLSGPENVSFMKKVGYDVLRIFQENARQNGQPDDKTSMIAIREYLSQHISELLRFLDKRTKSPFIKQ